MNIVIIGAGDIGTHTAALLSSEKHNVILVDQNRSQLEKMAYDLDVATVEGNGTDWRLLEELKEHLPDILLALTRHDETNLTICSMAKHLGYPITVARIRQDSFFNATRLDFGKLFHVDHFIAPELLIAQNLFKQIISPQPFSTDSFAHGSIQTHTLRVPENWKREEKKLYQLGLPEGIIVGVIRRQNEGDSHLYIFPHGDDVLLRLDEVTFIGESESLASLYPFFNLPPPNVESAVIVGGSLVGLHLAKILLRNKIKTTLIDISYDKCSQLTSQIPEATLYHHDGCDFNFLKSEQLGNADVFVTCTGSDEVNAIGASLGKKAGVERCFATIKNAAYSPILEQLRVDHILSPRVTTANRILSIIQRERVLNVATLYENNAVILEVKVSINSPLAGIPIADLGQYLPNDFLFAAIQNRGRIMIASGNKVLCPSDTVIIITHPRHLEEIQKLL